MVRSIIWRAKRPLSLILAVLLIITGIPTEMVFAEKDSESSEKYEVVLTGYEGCTYSYDEGHRKKGGGKSAVLEYKKGEKVQLQINTAENILVKEAHVCGNAVAEINIKWRENKISFSMPGENVTLMLKLENAAETRKTECETESETKGAV